MLGWALGAGLTLLSLPVLASPVLVCRLRLVAAGAAVVVSGLARIVVIVLRRLDLERRLGWRR